MREGRRLGGVGAGCIMCLCLGHWHSEQFAGSGDVVGTSATGEQAVVSDAMEALRQHVDEEAADELARLQRHGHVAAGPLDPVVLVPERDAGLVGGDEPAVGDRDPVGVAGQIGQHLLRPGERPLAIDEPLVRCSGAR